MGFGQRGGFRGGRGGFNNNQGPPAEVVVAGTFMSACEGEMVCQLTNAKVPFFNAPIYLQDKTLIGKVDEILGPLNEVFFTVKMQDGQNASQFKKEDKVYIGLDKLLPMDRFIPKPKVAGKASKPTGLQGKVEKKTKAPAARGGRGGFASRGGGRGGSRGGFGGGRGGGGFESRGGGRGGFASRGGGRGGFSGGAGRGGGGFESRGGGRGGFASRGGSRGGFGAPKGNHVTF